MARPFWFAALLIGLGLSRLALADVPATIPPAKPKQVQQTVERAIGYLQTESAAWLKTRKCAACHHVPMPLWALSEAERQGYAIDKKYLAETTESLLGSREKLMSTKIFPNPTDTPDPRPQGRGLNMGLPFLAVAAQSSSGLTEGQQERLKLIAQGNRRQTATRRLVGVLRHAPATTDQRNPDHRRRLDHPRARGWSRSERAGSPPRGDFASDCVARCRTAFRPPSRQGHEGVDGCARRQPARSAASHDRRVVGPATRRWRLESDRT